MKKVNLDKAVKTIEVFYDGRCGMCCTFMDWLEKQERACELICYDYHSSEATAAFPDLLKYHPEKVIVVRVDGEEVYQGAEGWVCCLWTCAKYRDVARRMNGSCYFRWLKNSAHAKCSINRLNWTICSARLKKCWLPSRRLPAGNQLPAFSLGLRRRLVRQRQTEL